MPKLKSEKAEMMAQLKICQKNKFCFQRFFTIERNTIVEHLGEGFKKRAIPTDSNSTSNRSVRCTEFMSASFHKSSVIVPLYSTASMARVEESIAQCPEVIKQKTAIGECQISPFKMVPAIEKNEFFRNGRRFSIQKVSN